MFIKPARHQEITSALILQKIKELANLNATARVVSVDTLCLIFKLSHEQMDPFIEELVSSRSVIRHHSQAYSSSNPKKDSVSLL